MASTIRARKIVESPLPSLRIGPHQTTSSAIKPLKFTGTLVPWPNFLSTVENAHISHHGLRRARIPSRNNGAHITEADRVHIGDERGLQGRFQQAIGHVMGMALEASSINLYFGDFRCLGRRYPHPPDVVGLQDANGLTEIKLVGELKVPWVTTHDLTAAVARERNLRKKIAQPLRDMQMLDCEYGFVSTYEQTIFLRQFQSPGGAWEVWYSQPISSSAYYVPTAAANPHLTPPQVSMKMCMFYVSNLASTSPPVHNNTRGWVVET